MSALKEKLVELEEIAWEKWTGLTPNGLSFLLLCWVYFRFLLYVFVCLVQYYVDSRPARVPRELQSDLTQENFERGRKYRRHKTIVQALGFLYILLIIHFVYIKWGLLYKLWGFSERVMKFLNVWPDAYDEEIGLTIICIVISFPLFNIMEVVPIQVADIIVEEIWGFNKQTVGFFVKDVLVKMIVQILVYLPIGTGILLIALYGGNYFFVWLWFLSFLAIGFFISIYPIWIAPHFDSYVPLGHGRLRERLRSLCIGCNFPVDEILILKESHRTSHSRAFFYGFGRSKRVVLSDNLLRRYLSENPSEEAEIHAPASRINFHSISANIGGTEQEIEALVAHEIAHWQEGHIFWDVAVTFGALLIQFLTFWGLYKDSKLYEAFDFPEKSTKPILIGFWIIYNHVLDTVNYVLGLTLKMFSRTCEFRADRFAVQKGYGEQLKRAIIKLDLDNMSYPYYSSLYIFYFHHSPPVLRRILYIDEAMRKMT